MMLDGSAFVIFVALRDCSDFKRAFSFGVFVDVVMTFCDGGTKYGLLDAFVVDIDEGGVGCGTAAAAAAAVAAVFCC